MNASQIISLIDTEIAKHGKNVNYIGYGGVNHIIELMETLGIEWSDSDFEYLLRCNALEQLKYYKAILLRPDTVLSL